MSDIFSQLSEFDLGAIESLKIPESRAPLIRVIVAVDE
jgi:hypothetical protein